MDASIAGMGMESSIIGPQSEMDESMATNMNMRQALLMSRVKKHGCRASWLACVWGRGGQVRGCEES